MLRRPTLTDARGRSVPLIALEMFVRDPAKRARLKRSNWALGPKAPLIFSLLMLTLFVFAILPAILARRMSAPEWIQMSTVALPAIVSTLGTIFWSRRLAPKQIAQTYLDAHFCPSCGYDLANVIPDPPTYAPARNVARQGPSLIRLDITRTPMGHARWPFGYTLATQEDPPMASAHTESKRYLSHTLADWACALKYSDLSPQAIHTAKLFWYDSLGCALGGSQQEDAHILLDHHRQMSGSAKGSGPCTTFVSGFKTNPVDASFLNDHMIRAMDYNDIYWKADPCHPSDIIAGPLALVEMLGLSGKDLILATVIAYEVEMRLCEFGLPGIREYGWHHATLTAFAAPIAAGRVLGLTPDQMVQAIGISASRTFTPGAVTAGKLTNMKNTVDPWATRMGVESALLAQRGYSGPEHMIDGKEGLYAVFGHVNYKGAAAKFDSDKLVGNLPSSKTDNYKIIDCGMKSFPIEALSHAPLTAMMKAVKENNVAASDVAEIKVEVIARAADILGDPHKYRPNSKETADHSLPYCMAVGLIDGMVTPLQFKEERVMDKSLEPVMDMVKVVANEEFEALFPKFQPSRVTITTKDGKQFAKRVDVPKGDPRDPMTEEEIGVKFNALGKGVVGEKRCRELGAHIMTMESWKDVNGLMRMMTAAPSAGPRSSTKKPTKKAAGKKASAKKPPGPAAKTGAKKTAKKATQKAARRR